MNSPTLPRMDDIRRFYDILEKLETILGGKRTLADCSGRMDWPQRGVYFFFEEGELRSTSGNGMRVVRVGTHGLKSSSHSTLWGRLKQHRGNEKNFSGNHRGSVFRHHVGMALAIKNKWPRDVIEMWPVGSSAQKSIVEREFEYEQQVSRYISRMPFLWLAVEDAAGPTSIRGFIERNTIALLSNFYSEDSPIDPPTTLWLGKFTGNQAIRRSGLWNVNHVADIYQPSLITVLEQQVNLLSKNYRFTLEGG